MNSTGRSEKVVVVLQPAWIELHECEPEGPLAWLLSLGLGWASAPCCVLLSARGQCDRQQISFIGNGTGAFNLITSLVMDALFESLSDTSWQKLS